MGLYLLLGLAVMLVSWWAHASLKRKFAHYSQVRLRNNMSGAEIARQMLNDNGIYDVKIISTTGELTDHYNPLDKTVNLSEAVYSGRNAAAAAVAAHECGHAVQHAQAYAWLGLRSKMVPAVNVSATIMNFANMILFVAGGALFYNNNPLGGTILLIIIAANLFLTLFAAITLPVEIDASRRALQWMQAKGIVTTNEYSGAKDALKWAALTYVIAAAGALANLLYFVSLYFGRNNDDE